MIGSTVRAPAQQAALANGAAAHALDYDTQLAERPDRVYGLLTHPSAPVLPAVLALAELTGASSREALAAYTLGVEVACKLAEAANPRLYEAGFHTTGVVGALGAAAGAVWLLTRDAEVIARALSVAASMAGRLREQFGTMTKPLHAGRAAENGVVAAQLAAAGFTAAENVLEAPRGFCSAYAGGFDEAVVRGRLGNPLEPAPAWRLAQAGALRIADAPGHRRLARPPARARRALRAGRVDPGRRQSAHAERAAARHPDRRAAGKVQPPLRRRRGAA